MDIDRYIARNEPTWVRLDECTRRARRSISSMTPADLEELVQLYQRTSSHLSYVRTNFREPTLIARLTRLVASANGVIYGKRAKSWRAVATFFVTTYPAAVYHCRKQIRLAALLFFVPALLLGIWLSVDQHALDTSAAKKVRQEYVHEQFEPYYSDQASAVFFTEVTTNNIRVSFLAFAGGAAFCVVGAFMLVTNGVGVGQAAAWMISEGDTMRFFGLILPHGLLELSAICIAGGAGLRLGWTLIAPGDRPRAAAMAEQGRRSIVIVIGLMTMFIAAGSIEGFVTGSGLAPAPRVAIGVVAWLAYVTYLVGFGRAAAAKGFTGELGEVDRAADRTAARRLDPVAA